MSQRQACLVLHLILMVAMPAAAQAPPAGTLTERVVFDSSYHRLRRIWVYTPPGYDAHRAAPYPMILAFDGAEYQDSMPLPMVLDTLLATGRSPAFVAVLVDDSSGAVAFLGQLVSWVRHGWHVTADPHWTIVTGSSAGGLASAYVAFARPDLFGNVWSQSGAFWRGAEASNGAPWEWLTSQVLTSPRKDVRFVLDALRSRGYGVTYTEVPGGNHAPQWWRQRLADGIVSLSAGWPRE